MTLMLLAGGFLQGANLENPALPFSESIETVLPYLRRTQPCGILTVRWPILFSHITLV